MKLKKYLKKIFIVLMAVFMLLGEFSTRAYAVEKNRVAVETQKGNSKYSRKKKQEKEYEKWRIKKIDGIYFFKQKRVRLLVDDSGEKAVINNFFFSKKGKVDIKVIRNKKGKIKNIKYISKKRAEKMLKNYSTMYYINKK